MMRMITTAKMAESILRFLFLFVLFIFQEPFICVGRNFLSIMNFILFGSIVVKVIELLLPFLEGNAAAK